MKTVHSEVLTSLAEGEVYPIGHVSEPGTDMLGMKVTNET